MQHYHTCKIAAENAGSSIPEVIQTEGDDEDVDMAPPDGSEPTNGPRLLTNADITPEKIAEARSKAENERDATHGLEAVKIGQAKGVFVGPSIPIKLSAIRATPQDVQSLKTWQGALQQSLSATINSSPTGAATDDIGGVSRLVSTGAALQGPDLGDVIPREQIYEQSINPAAYDELFPEQQRAFDIIRWHLSKTLDAANRIMPPPPQLLMLLVGEGGTGKSKVIQTVTAEFERRGLAHLLLKSAYTGIAASLIDGKTTHNIGCISVNGEALSDSGKKKLAHIWKDIQYLILDECSMLSKAFFGQLSRHIAVAKMMHKDSPHVTEPPLSNTLPHPNSSERPFGGVNVILCGDFHQFPPVAGGTSSALYHPNRPGIDSADVSLGGKTYTQFKTVVILRRQVRVSDPVWRDFLTCLRVGKLKPDHESMLNSLVLTHPRCIPTDFNSETWKDVSLVTPRHSVRTRWNDAAVARHCQRTGNQLFHCPAHDSIKGRALSLAEQYVAVASNSGDGGKKSRNKKNRLPESVPLAVGMNVMVTLNVETDLDLANGARGTIVAIYLDPEEQQFDATAPVVTLQRLPLCILVKMSRTRAITLPGLEPGILPITPASKSFQITTTVRQRDGTLVKVRKNVRRRQFPITPAYAFTDYRSQGQTIKSVIVDIARPPSGSKLNLFNTYVALSRSSGRDTIRLLRGPDREALMQPLDADLAAEDRRLEDEDAKTKIWWDSIVAQNSHVPVPM